MVIIILEVIKVETNYNEVEEKNFIDTEFKEDNYTKYIRGKPIYYKTSEVAMQLNTTDSTVRFYCGCFNDFLNIETSGRNRRFKDGDIEKLKFIQKLLKEDGLSIQQVKEYLSEPDIENKVIKQDDPLPVQIIASATAMEVGIQLNDFMEQLKEALFKDLKQQQEANKDEIKEYLAVAIKEQIGEISNYINSQELEAKKRDEEILNTLKKGMEERDKLNQELQKEKSKGLFGRLFKK
jgi:DNA-binding transcriptional MerR regulator